jgi:hypothetical protein
MADQLAVWDLLAGDRATASKDAASASVSGLTQSDVIVRFLVMPTASASQWETRASQAFAAPQIASLRLTALGYALILDGKRQAAIPVWEEIVKQLPGNNFFPRALLARLKGEIPEHFTAPDPNNFNQFAAVPDRL